MKTVSSVDGVGQKKILVKEIFLSPTILHPKVKRMNFAVLTHKSFYKKKKKKSQINLSYMTPPASYLSHQQSTLNP